MPEAGTTIENTNATTDVPNNYEICDRTGWRVLPGKLVKEENGMMVREDSFETRHPQDILRARVSDRFPGSKSPEPDNVFLSDNEVTADDL
jgi:hypothetical protein